MVDALHQHFAGGPFQIRAHELAAQAGSDRALAARLLAELAEVGVLGADNQYICPCERRETLSSDNAAKDVCSICERAFEADVPGRPTSQPLYIREAPATRDVQWLLALHGMNTTGAWQEAFNWLVSRTYGHAVPVAIYKYGIIRPGVILKFRQRALVRQLQGRIARLSGETSETGFGRIPDVIAHSFGTWLLGHALLEDKSLRVGRVILTGSILRPDFDWGALIARGQVEAVFCHTATKDIWARIAHYIIPDSGPSGVRGFNDLENVSHAVLTNGHHSDFFLDKQMPRLFDDVWQPFLTEAKGAAARTDRALPEQSWKAASWPFRATILRYLVLALISLLALALIAAFALGIVDLWHLLRR